MVILTLKSDNEIYQGQVLDNIKSGYGRLWNKEYNYYGYFKDNTFEGEGMIEYNNNTLFKEYKGGFKIVK